MPRQFITTAWKRITDDTARRAAAHIAFAIERLARDIDKALTLLESSQAASSAPPSAEVISTGTTMLYVDGATCPTGWTSLNDTGHSQNMTNNFPIGGDQNPFGDWYRGDSGGNSNHNHSFTLVLDPSTTPTHAITSGAGYSVSVDDHTHTINPTISSLFTLPPFINVLFCRKD